MDQHCCHTIGVVISLGHIPSSSALNHFNLLDVLSHVGPGLHTVEHYSSSGRIIEWKAEVFISSLLTFKFHLRNSSMLFAFLTDWSIWGFHDMTWGRILSKYKYFATSRIQNTNTFFYKCIGMKIQILCKCIWILFLILLNTFQPKCKHIYM